MSYRLLSWRRSGLAWAALLVAGSPAWAQGVPPPGDLPLRYSFGALNPSFNPRFAPYQPPAPVGYGAPLPYAATGNALRPLAPLLSSPAIFGPTVGPWLNQAGYAEQPYEVEARWKKDGKTARRQRHIVVHAGDTLRIDLVPPEASKEAAGR
jgi:hypothetical protein